MLAPHCGLTVLKRRDAALSQFSKDWNLEDCRELRALSPSQQSCSKLPYYHVQEGTGQPL